MDWAEIFFSSPIQKFLHKKAQKTFNDVASAEIAETYVYDRISADDWEKCRKFKGEATPEAFLRTVVSRLLIDYGRTIDIRPRPPQWLKQQGPLWVNVWTWLCVNRHERETVIDFAMSAEPCERDIVEAMIRVIKARLPWCGVSRPPHQEQKPEESLRPPEWLEVMRIVAVLLSRVESEDATNPLWEEASNELRAQIKALEISTEEALILRLHFCDGENISAVARRLQLKRAYCVRQLETVLRRIREQVTFPEFEGAL